MFLYKQNIQYTYKILVTSFTTVLPPLHNATTFRRKPQLKQNESFLELQERFLISDTINNIKKKKQYYPQIKYMKDISDGRYCIGQCERQEHNFFFYLNLISFITFFYNKMHEAFYLPLQVFYRALQQVRSRVAQKKHYRGL